MSKSTDNHYFTNPCRIGRPQVTESTFERLVRALCLAPDQYSASPELKAWVRRNKNYKYVPPDFPPPFGFSPGAKIKEAGKTSPPPPSSPPSITLTTL